MPRRFPNTSYGPIELRRLLRRRLEPGERVVGWGSAHLNPSAARTIVSLSLGLFPGVGQAIAALDSLLQLSKRRVLVLTDRRLLVLRADVLGLTRDGRGVVAEAFIGCLRVACPGAQRADAAGRIDAKEVTRFTLVDGRGERVELTLPRTNGTAAERLREALVMLAGDRSADEAARGYALVDPGALS